VSAIPKPITTRLPYAIKQLMHKNAVHGQQIINMQTQMATQPDFPAATVAPAAGAPPAYSQDWGTDVTAQLNALIASLQAAGVIAS
jgi:hypothetical protein